MRNTPKPQFFLSILSAIITGVGVAYASIFSIQLVAKPEISSRVFSLVAASTDFMSKGFSYAAEANEEVGNDITLTGESISSFDPSSAAISALAYSVQSLDKENTLVEKDSDRLLPIASITKLITAAVARKLMDENETITISERAQATEGDTGRLRAGEKYKLKELLYPLLMVSSNDAATAIAEAYDAKHVRGKFVKEMNEWANSIGAYRTYLRDPSGLSADNVSTAHDLSLIAKWINTNDQKIFDITLTKAKTVRTRTWTNPTRFLSLSSYSGGKNGYTAEARLTNLSIFSLGSPKRVYSVVLLGSSNRDKDTLAVLNQAVK